MGTRKHRKSKKSSKRFRKTRSKRGGVINNNIKLIRSSMFGNREAVKKLLKEGADVNAKNSDGYTALILASSNGRTEIVAMLLDAGANVNARTNTNYWGSTALIRASENKHTEIVSMLLDNGADVNATDDDGDTALMRVINCDEEDDRPWYQVEYDIIEIVEMLLTAGADVNVVNNNNKTALDIAEETGCTKQIKKLIIKHIVAQPIPKHLEIQEQRKKDRENLHMVMSAKRIHPDLERYTSYNLGGKRKTHKHHHKKKHGRKTRSKRQRGGGITCSRLGHCAADENNQEEDPNTIDEYLALAIVEETPDQVKQYLDEGANPNITILDEHPQISEQVPIIVYTARHIQPSTILRHLLERHIIWDDMNTPLLIEAAEWGNLPTVEYLLDLGADINATTPTGVTAIGYAVMNGDIPMIRLMLDKRRGEIDFNYTAFGSEHENVIDETADPEIAKILKNYAIEQRLPIHSERQKKRLQVGRVMDKKRMPEDLTHKIITEHFGGKRKTRTKKSKRPRRRATRRR